MQYYPEYFDMFQQLDSVIKRADAIRYFIMHAIGGGLAKLAVQLAAVCRLPPAVASERVDQLDST